MQSAHLHSNKFTIVYNPHLAPLSVTHLCHLVVKLDGAGAVETLQVEDAAPPNANAVQDDAFGGEVNLRSKTRGQRLVRAEEAWWVRADQVTRDVI